MIIVLEHLGGTFVSVDQSVSLRNLFTNSQQAGQQDLPVTAPAGLADGAILLAVGEPVDVNMVGAQPSRDFYSVRLLGKLEEL
jgi:hypothetical protein